jgi:hypothetical protein
MKVVGLNVIFEITVLREALVIEDFLIIVNCLVDSRDEKLQLF